MKRKQKYIVSVLHRAAIDAIVIAENREEAKRLALKKFFSAKDMDSDFVNREPIIESVRCLGTAEKTKARKK